MTENHKYRIHDKDGCGTQFLVISADGKKLTFDREWRPGTRVFRLGLEEPFLKFRALPGSGIVPLINQHVIVLDNDFSCTDPESGFMHRVALFDQDRYDRGVDVII